MRSRIPFFLFLVAMVALFPMLAVSNGSGGPAKRTGAPGDGDGTPGNSGTCNDVGCHNTFALNSGSGGITFDGPVAYGTEPVEIVLTVSDPDAQRFGFQLTAKDADSTNVGSFELIGETRFAAANPNYVTHNLASSQNSWTVRWIPTGENFGDVTLYVAGNGADGRFNSANDRIYTDSYTLSPVTGLSSAEEVRAITHVRMGSPYPTPVRAEAALPYALTRVANVRIALHDILGRRVWGEDWGVHNPGTYERTLRPDGLPSGLYFIVLEADDERLARPINIVR